jgi:hypothetical protein
MIPPWGSLDRGRAEQPGRLNWTQDEPSWGIWSVPESQLAVLPEDVQGLDVIELGCGTGYVRRG